MFLGAPAPSSGGSRSRFATGQGFVAFASYAPMALEGEWLKPWSRNLAARSGKVRPYPTLACVPATVENGR